MPNRKRAIEPSDESGASLRPFMDSEKEGSLSASEPDPDLENVKGLETFEPWRPWSEEDVEGGDEWNARDRGAD